MPSFHPVADRAVAEFDRATLTAGSWLCAAAAACVIVPDLVMFAKSYWLSDRGLHGIIVAGLGGWLLMREWPRGPARRGNPWLSLPLLALCLAAHCLFTVIGAHWLIWVTLCAVVTIVAYDRIGVEGLKRIWFPIGFLLLAVPPSGKLMSLFTFVLTDWMSAMSVETLWTLGWDIARDRTTIYFGPYELLVVDACAGLNSLISLFAMGTFFLYLRRDSSPVRLAVLGALVLPIVILSGLARTTALLLLTDTLGDRAAQGPMHDLTGLAMFALAFAIFALCDRLLPRTAPAGAHA